MSDKPKTMIAQIQEYLEAGNKIDVHKCAEMFQSVSIASKIQQLRLKGIEIESAKKEDNPKVTEYWIKK